MIAPDVAAQGPRAPVAVPEDRVFSGHPVRVPAFEGPLDLLLYLIERDQIDIFDIPIEHITSEHLDYLHGLDSPNIEVVGEFLVMAAHLLEIKSRMLLPQEQRPETEEEEVGDPRAALAARLLEYRRYKTVAEDLRARADMRALMFSRAGLSNGNGNGNGHADRAYLMLNDVSAFDLWAAFQTVLSRVREAPSTEVARPRFTVAQKIAAIAARVRWAKGGVNFVDLFHDSATRVELIVTFLALLELIRVGRVRVAQESLFGEIRVYPGGRPDSE